MGQAKMVVGLGNPGKRYAGTRHNVGFRVVDRIAGSPAGYFPAGPLTFRKKKFGALVATGTFSGGRLILVKPWRFMNLSGSVTAAAVGFYGISTENLLVVSDEMALEAGVVRLRPAGSAGGHKGLLDIIERLGTENFPRLRLGIGSCGGRPGEDYVLEEPGADEQPLLDEAVHKAAEAVLCWASLGIDAAMNRFN
jgi:PTH1 family peptidyl-tRNA hydrolase